MTRIVPLVAALLALVHQPVCGQAGDAIAPGDLLRVSVDGLTNRVVEGHLWFIEDRTLVLQEWDRERVDLPIEQIVRIEREVRSSGKGSSLLMGSVLGAAIGAASFNLLARGFPEADVAAATIGGGVTGLLAGTFIGALAARPVRMGWEEVPIPIP